MKYIAYLTKGLERVAQREIEQLISDVKVEEIGDKRIIFETDQPISTLVQLKTVDDLGLYIGEINSIKEVSDVVQFLRSQNLVIFKQYISQFRDVEDSLFSLTVGSSGSSLKIIIESLTQVLMQQCSWRYTEFDHTNFDVRIFIDHKTAYFSVRVTEHSLYQRSYKAVSKPGSLKPSVAAAMVYMATKKAQSSATQKNKVVDNFCGSGTILCEARLSGHDVYGGDIDPESVHITRTNLRNLGYEADEKVTILTATKTNWPNSFFDCAISNLPWDKQIKVNSITALYQASITQYIRILKPSGVLCALVSKPELFIKYIKKLKPKATIETQKIGLLGQNPTIVLVT